MAKKYLVGENVAFTSEGNIFKTGDEISKSVFSDLVYFDKLLSEGKIVAVEVSEKSENSEKSEKSENSEKTENSDKKENSEKTETNSESKKSKGQK